MSQRRWSFWKEMPKSVQTLPWRKLYESAMWLLASFLKINITKTQSGCKIGEKCMFMHKEVDSQPDKKAKKNAGKGSVALLKKSKQFGCVFEDAEPPKFKSILGSERSVNFSKGTSRHVKIRGSIPRRLFSILNVISSDAISNALQDQEKKVQGNLSHSWCSQDQRRMHEKDNKGSAGDCLRDLLEWLVEFTENLEDTEVPARNILRKWLPGSTVFILTSPKTEIATYAWEPKLRG